jgi:hypothetical protein
MPYGRKGCGWYGHRKVAHTTVGFSCRWVLRLWRLRTQRSEQKKRLWQASDTTLDGSYDPAYTDRGIATALGCHTERNTSYDARSHAGPRGWVFSPLTLSVPGNVSLGHGRWTRRPISVEPWSCSCWRSCRRCRSGYHVLPKPMGISLLPFSSLCYLSFRLFHAHKAILSYLSDTSILPKTTSLLLFLALLCAPVKCL